MLQYYADLWHAITRSSLIRIHSIQQICFSERRHDLKEEFAKANVQIKVQRVPESKVFKVIQKNDDDAKKTQIVKKSCSESLPSSFYSDGRKEEIFMLIEWNKICRSGHNLIDLFRLSFKREQLIMCCTYFVFSLSIIPL